MSTNPINAQIDRELAQTEAHFSKAPAAFLHSLREGIALAGPHLFGDGTREGLERAQDKLELPPKTALIHDVVGVMSTGQRVFLAALLSFYDLKDGGRLLERIGVPGLADLSRLDLKRRAIIAALLLNCARW